MILAKCRLLAKLHHITLTIFPWNPSPLKLQALDYLWRSRGIQRTRELAEDHANRAVEAINSLPECDEEDVLVSRRALVDLTQCVMKGTKRKTKNHYRAENLIFHSIDVDFSI